MKTLAHWMPAAFCAFLSYGALVMQIQLRSDSDAWKPAFYCFLPMCFIFVGVVTRAMHKELKDLRERLAALEQKKPGA
jgi:hypothetical protein